ncbi:hypothetical protein DENSPDRAFT_85757 [Dentipellis sp. KUC8613]|nr:hypothetical protein DENSPDRAFT_85757 [Dentipellis sp. KUC8613]
MMTGSRTVYLSQSRFPQSWWRASLQLPVSLQVRASPPSRITSITQSHGVLQPWPLRYTLQSSNQARAAPLFCPPHSFVSSLRLPSECCSEGRLAGLRVYMCRFGEPICSVERPSDF